MPAIFLPTTVANAGTLPQATFTDLSQLREYESTSTEHWIFDKGSSAGLVGRKAGGLLTQVGGTAPTYSANSLTLATAVGNQLASTSADQLTYTWAGVVKVPAVDGGFIGRAVFSTEGTNVGAYLSIQGSNTSELFSRAQTTGQNNQQAVNIATIATGSYQFYAFAMDHTGANRLQRLSTGVVTYDFTSAAQFTVNGARNLSLGSGTGAAALNGNEFCEAILFAGVALTPTQLTDVYMRSKARMARRGITIN